MSDTACYFGKQFEQNREFLLKKRDLPKDYKFCGNLDKAGIKKCDKNSKEKHCYKPAKFDIKKYPKENILNIDMSSYAILNANSKNQFSSSATSEVLNCDVLGVCDKSDGTCLFAHIYPTVKLPQVKSMIENFLQGRKPENITSRILEGIDPDVNSEINIDNIAGILQNENIPLTSLTMGDFHNINGRKGAYILDLKTREISHYEKRFPTTFAYENQLVHLKKEFLDWGDYVKDPNSLFEQKMIIKYGENWRETAPTDPNYPTITEYIFRDPENMYEDYDYKE